MNGVRWAVAYIKRHYGGGTIALPAPEGDGVPALLSPGRFVGWYDRGGFLPVGASVCRTDGGPERVLTPEQWQRFGGAR